MVSSSEKILRLKTATFLAHFASVRSFWYAHYGIVLYLLRYLSLPVYLSAVYLLALSLKTPKIELKFNLQMIFESGH